MEVFLIAMAVIIVLDLIIHLGIAAVTAVGAVIRSITEK